MAYKDTILKDSPLSFYLLDEVLSATTVSYTALKTKFTTYQDLKDRGISYSNISGQPVYDYSGNAFDGYCNGLTKNNLMPLIRGGIRSTHISGNTKIFYNAPGVASKNYSDNLFSMEIWVEPPTISTNRITIAGDPANNIGIFYQNSDIIFKVGNNEIRHKVPSSKSVYVAVIYGKTYMQLFIDGILEESLSIDPTPFTNLSFDPQTGPSDGTNNFIVDCPAFYKYVLTAKQIYNHYLSGINELDHSQIVYPDGGRMFSLNSSKIRSQLRYSYPQTKPWSKLANSNVKISSDGSYITFAKTSTAATASFTFTEEYFIPSYLNIKSSQISWDDDVDNISVQASIDGFIWQNCSNNFPLPYFNKNDNTASSLLYIKVTMASSDTSKDIPRLSNLSIDFYQNKDFYGDNSGEVISSTYDYSLGRYNYTTLSCNEYNGLRMYNGHGFDLSLSNPVRTIEMIFAPDDSATGYQANVLFSSPSASYKWSNTGAITKSGISNVFVNGVDCTSSTNISDFLTPGAQFHIIIVASANISSGLKFNQSQDGQAYGMANLYNNIAVYSTAFNLTQANAHYLLYAGTSPTITTSDSQFTVSESVTGNNNTGYIVNNLNLLSSSL
jgi:hypothetical protein